MKTVTAKQAHKQLGLVLDEAQHEPVQISKNGRPYSVVISAKLFASLQGVKALQADKAWDKAFENPNSENLLAKLASEAKADKVFDYDPSNRPQK